MGPDGARLGAARRAFPDRGLRRGWELGLLRARLGRLVGVGSGRECVLDAVAGRDRLYPFAAGHGKARHAEILDDPPGAHDVLIEPGRDIRSKAKIRRLVDLRILI